MMILPLICILIGFVLYIKKFKIDEETYANILSDLKAREESAKQETEAAAKETAEIETK
jgi:melibiose permease/lactose/raffinose/galactose permease